ncbi:head-tail connector protein [Sporolactobacillus sp. STCC-11]|uniref:head-tail connector protein n=1 Tax=Sporolactobacillus caesalpiniae TaxID=3230362 RepID=UPI00339304F4
MLLADIKLSLRITNAAFDTEIDSLIAAAQRDLIRAGLSADQVNSESADPLIRQAITLYVKANFGLDNEDSDKYQRSYGLLRNELTMSQDYLQAGDANV